MCVCVCVHVCVCVFIYLYVGSPTGAGCLEIAFRWPFDSVVHSILTRFSTTKLCNDLQALT